MFEEGIMFQKEIEKQLKQKEKERQKQIREFYHLRYETASNSLKETESKRISICNIALELLEELGFDIKQSGTIYLADIIEELYHERRMYDKENPYFDLNDRKNNHYVFVKDYYECGLSTLLERIDESISTSYVSDMPINNILYGVTNDIIDQYDRNGPIKKYQITK